MSYMFYAKGPSKTDAVLDADAKMDKLAEDMPIHELDKELVLLHMRNLMTVVPDPTADQEITVIMNGHLSNDRHMIGSNIVIYVHGKIGKPYGHA